MKVLREWNGDSHQPIIDVLKKFGVEAHEIFLHKYEAITPDSFIWAITVNEIPYYIYAEDFVDSLAQVTSAIKQNLASWTPDDKVELVPVLEPGEWAKSTPVKSADVYTPPSDPAELMKFAAQSGYDFVFLAKVLNSGIKTT